MKRKSLLELVREKIQDPELTLDETQEAAINYFEQETSALTQKEAEIAAEVITNAVYGDQEFGGTGPEVKELMDISSMRDAYFDDEKIEAMGAEDLDTLNTHLADVDFSTKALIIDMMDKARYDGQDVSELISDLTQGLAVGSPEEKRDYLMAQDKERFAEMGKELQVDEQVARDDSQVFDEVVFRVPGQGGFLAEKVFKPVMQNSPATSRATSSGDLTASSSGSVAEEEAREASSRQGIAATFAEELDTPIGQAKFMQTVQHEQREEMERMAVEAVSALDQVSGTDGKYEMSEGDQEDSVNITKGEHGYVIKPGQNFTGVIKMKREVDEGAEPSFDVIEFENGVMVSGVEGTRGKSKIANLADLRQPMFEQHETVPLFAFYEEGLQQSAYTSYVTRMAEELSATPSARRDTLAEEQAVVPPKIQDAESSIHIERKREMVPLKEAIKEQVSSHLEVVKKTGVPGKFGRTYHAEKAALVDEVAETVMGVFTARDALDHGRVERYQKEIVASVGKAMQEQKAGLQAILDQAESKDDPAHVRQEYLRQKLENGIASVVWKDCEDMVAREELRAAMVKQMQTRVQPAGGYEKYRDDLVANIVDQTMAKLSEGMTARVIEDNKEKLLKDFETATKKHDGAIRTFLTEHEEAWKAADVSSARGHQGRSVMEKIAADTMEFTAAAKDANKQKAVDELKSELRAAFVDPKKGGITAASWWSKAGTYWKERDALVDQMLDDMGKDLMANGKIKTEMLYNNREAVIEAATEQLKQNQEEIKEFLSRKENQNVAEDVVKDHWKSAGTRVSEGVTRGVADTLQENQIVSDEKTNAVEALEQEMFEAAKKAIPAVQKSWSMPGASPDYYKERDQMAILVASQAKKSLEESDISAGALKRDHDEIMKRFTESIGEHAEEIQARLKAVEKAKKIGDRGEAVAHDVLMHREDEVRDVDIAADVAEQVKKSAEAMVREDTAKRAARKVPGLQGVLAEPHDHHGPVTAARSPRRSGDGQNERSM